MKNIKRPYFVTWTKQNDALTLPLDKMDQFHFIASKKKWLDLSSISYQASFGHKNKKILTAMKKQMDDFPVASPKHTFKLKEEVSKEILKVVGKADNYKCFYTQSGSEGIENALKMARQLSGKPLILSLKNSYHGATMAALSITGDWRHDNHLLPDQWRKHLPDPQKDLDGKKLEEFLLKLDKRKLAAICLETITGGNGVFSPSKEWWKKLMQLKNKLGFYLICDEVVCAPYRTGKFFGYHQYSSVKPDFIVTAKAMTGGYFPLGCLLVSEKLASYYNENILSFGLTNYAHPIGLAACKSVLEYVKTNEFLDIKEENEINFKNFFDSLDHKIIKGTRSFGLLGAIDLRKNTITQRDFLNNNLYIAVQNNRAILAPPINMTPSLLKKGLRSVARIIHEY